MAFKLHPSKHVVVSVDGVAVMDKVTEATDTDGTEFTDGELCYGGIVLAKALIGKSGKYTARVVLR
jgi:hypothetical protein